METSRWQSVPIRAQLKTEKGFRELLQKLCDKAEQGELRLPGSILKNLTSFQKKKKLPAIQRRYAEQQILKYYQTKTAYSTDMPISVGLSDSLQIRNIPADLSREIEVLFTMVNPKWLENQRTGRWNGKTPKTLHYFRKTEDALYLPRGTEHHVLEILDEKSISLGNNTRALPEVSFKFKGKLKGFQTKACTDLLAKDFGTLCSPTGSGKTVMALHCVYVRRQPALIVVHTKELAEQWCARIETFLGVPKKEIGRIGGGKKTIGDRITVALVQSLYKCAKDVSNKIGFLLVDECHRCPSRTFTEAVSYFDSMFMMGLSATPFRKDGLSQIIFWYMGELLHTVQLKKLQEDGDVLVADVYKRCTDFIPFYDPVAEYVHVLSEMAEDRRRNQMIAKDVEKSLEVNAGAHILLTDRKQHCTILKETLRNRGVRSQILSGDVKDKHRKLIIKKIETGSIKVVISTSQLIAEGFDSAQLTVLFLTMPLGYKGRVIQSVGRILRPADGKEKGTIYDYVDTLIKQFENSWSRRKSVYKKNNFTLMEGGELNGKNEVSRKKETKKVRGPKRATKKQKGKKRSKTGPR